MSYGTAADLQRRLTRDGVTETLDAATLDGLLDDAQDLIDGYCGRDFEDHADAEVTAEGKGLDSLLLPVSPLRSVSAVSVDGLPLTSDELEGLTALSYGVLRGYRFPAASVVQISCAWGYVEPPAKVVSAALLLASRLYRFGSTRDKAAQGLRSQSVEGVSLSVDPIEMDRDVAKLLAPYVKKRSAR